MKLSFSLALLLFLFCVPLAHSSTIEYRGVIRDAEGVAVSNKPATIDVAIIPNLSSTAPLFSEQHSVTTDSRGAFHILIGTTQSNNTTLEELPWGDNLLLRVTTETEVTDKIITTSSILHTPKAHRAATAGKLLSTSADGSLWQLAVSNTGDISWKKVTTEGGSTNPDEEEDTGEPAYDKSKWPQELYLVGNFCDNWNPAASLKFTKSSEGKFLIKTTLKPGYIFKFIQVQSWNGERDWSAESSTLNERTPMKESGDTPEFSESAGEYYIYVDFFNYIIKIYPATN